MRHAYWKNLQQSHATTHGSLLYIGHLPVEAYVFDGSESPTLSMIAGNAVINIAHDCIVLMDNPLSGI